MFVKFHFMSVKFTFVQNIIFMSTHIELFNKVAKNDVQAYEKLFKEYYKFLCSYAYGITNEKHASEEIVENFFLEIWDNRQKIKISTSVRSYFVSSIHNRCINYIQREKPRFLSFCDISKLIDDEGSAGDKLIAPEIPSLLINELESVLAKAIDNLPHGCRDVFLLSRYKNLNYEEISIKLNISVNTVKTQIKIALRKLRENLQDYLTVILLFIIK